MCKLTHNLKQLFHILTILWLGILSSQLAYAATCPTDSVIGYDQNSNPISKTLYQYDEAGRTTVTENWKLNTDSVLVGTTKTTTEYYPNGKIKSTATWMWSTAITPNGWIGKDRNDYTYDAQGNTILWSIYSWDNTTNDWTNKNKYEYQYENKKQTLAITYTGSGTQWIPKTKSENQYDAKGHTILNRYYSSYDAANSKWIGDHWYEYQYNAANQLLLSKKYTWDTTKGDWKGETQTEYGYNAAGKQTLYIYYTWDATASAFIGSTKTITDYDQWTNTILREQYTYNLTNQAWVGTQKVRYEYTSYNSDPIMTATFQWDATTASFIGVDSIRTASDEAKNIILDEQYTWSGNDWAGSKKEEYTYNADKLVLSTIAYKWDVTNKSWGNNTKVLADYDAHKNQTLDERYQWTTDAALAEGGYWKGTKYETTTYNDKNVETDKITYQWDDTNRRWLGNNKSIYEFDAAGHLILEEQYTWNLNPAIPEGGVWKGTKKEEFGYNAANQQTKAITYAWSDVIDDWIGSTKKLSNFDSYKNQTLSEQYTWQIEATEEGGYWRGTEKEEYTFNSQKQQTSSLIYAWDDTARDWTYVSKTKATYDSRKNQTLDERYTYDATAQTWVGTTKWEAAFDAAKNQTMDAQYTWEDGAWVGTSKKEYGFNADKQQVMFATYKWQDGTWVGTQKEERELDDEGREILVASYKWGSGTWIGKSRVVTTYYKDKLIASLANYDWRSNQWVGSDSTLYTYSAADLETCRIIMLYQTSAWVNSTKQEQTYNATNSLAAKYNFIWQSNAWQPTDKWEAHFDMAGRMDVDSTMVYKNNTWIYLNKNTNHYDSQDRLTLIMTENWDDGVPSTGSKTENTYGEFGLTTTLTSQMQSGIWVGLTQTNNTYNTAGQLTQTLEQENTASGWQTTHLYQATYDGDKQTLSMNQQYADGVVVSGERIVYEYTATENIETTSTWESSAWVEQTRIGYYQSGNLSIETHYIHDGTQWIGNTKVETITIDKNKEIATYQWQGGWTGISKIGAYYDEYEDETSASWIWKNGAWVCDTKKGESKYDDGKPKSQTTYKIVSNTFVFNSRVEYEYGTGAKDITTATYTYNTTNQAWVGVSKSGVTYNGAKIASETTYTWTGGFTWQPNQMKEYEYGDQSKDLTTAIYTWNTTSQSWVGVSKSGVTYAANGKQASQFSYVWGTVDSVKAGWLPVTKTEWEYGEGKNNAIATYKGVDTAWVGVSKYEEVYTSMGDSLGFYNYCWRNNAWADSLKREYTYNEYGDKVLYIDAQWNGTAWANTANSTKWEIKYYDYEKGLTTLDAHYYWKTNKNTWYGTGTKLENTYDDRGNKTSEMKSSWKSSSWQYSSKQEWEFDEYGYTILSMYWTRDGNKWKGVTKSEYKYAADKTQLMSATYKFNTTKTIWDWQGISKSEIILDEHNNKIGDITYKWSTSIWTWIGLFKYEYTYDDQNRIVEQLTYRYADPDGWYLDTKTINEYDTKHGKIATYIYEFVDGNMRPQSITKQVYDEDANSKQRTDLYAIWSNGNLQTYEDKTYYYHCDPKFTITVNTSEEGVGEVRGGGVYTYYARPQIAAIESPNCNTFHQWSDSVTTATRRILVTEDKTYTAVFKPIERTIRASVKGGVGGSVAVQRKSDN